MTVRGPNATDAAAGAEGARVPNDPGGDSFVAAVLRASAALAGIATRSLAAAPGGATLAQYRLLVLLDSRGPQMPSALAGELGAAPSSVTRLCDRLVAKG